MKTAEGQGHLQGREWGVGGSRRGTPNPLTWSLGRDPFLASEPCSTRGSQGPCSCLWSTESEGRGPLGVRGPGQAPSRAQRWGSGRVYGASFPRWKDPAPVLRGVGSLRGVAHDFRPPSPRPCVSELPSPHSKCNPVGVQGWGRGTLGSPSSDSAPEGRLSPAQDFLPVQS